MTSQQDYNGNEKQGRNQESYNTNIFTQAHISLWSDKYK